MKGFIRSIAMYILIFVVIIMLVQSMVQPSSDPQKISYSELILQIKKDNVKSLTFTENEVNGIYRDDKEFNSYVPTIFILSSTFYEIGRAHV